MIKRTEPEERQLEQELIIRNIMCIRSIKDLLIVSYFVKNFDREPIITEEREQRITDFVRGFEA